MDEAVSHERARAGGAGRLIYFCVRGLCKLVLPFYFRASRSGQEHIPRSGPLIIVANHRSFLDPFLIGTMTPRPLYFVAKSEMFRNPVLAWLFTALGAFPVRRGEGDGDSIRTAKELLARGEAVLIFPEGTRTRPGPLGRPKRGAARLALESGAAVVPITVHGTDRARRGFVIRPCKVRARVGEALRFGPVAEASPELAAATLEEMWQRIALQWERFGGEPSPDRGGRHGEVRAA